MKRGRKTMLDEPLVTKSYSKCTYLLPANLKANLMYIALSQGREQSDLVREVLADFIRSEGLNPAKPPVFVFDRIK